MRLTGEVVSSIALGIDYPSQICIGSENRKENLRCSLSLSSKLSSGTIREHLSQLYQASGNLKNSTSIVTAALS